MRDRPIILKIKKKKIITATFRQHYFLMLGKFQISKSSNITKAYLPANTFFCYRNVSRIKFSILTR